jgi:hypothetical protein
VPVKRHFHDARRFGIEFVTACEDRVAPLEAAKAEFEASWRQWLRPRFSRADSRTARLQ